MNKHVGTSQMTAGASWERPVNPPTLLDNRSEDDIQTWWQLVDSVADVAKANSWTKAEVARRINMADGTFSQWFSGKYAGRLDTTNKAVAQWLAALHENASIAATIPQSPPFMKLRGASEIIDTLLWAQLCPDLVMITLGAGMGKTETCRHFELSRRHVYRATVSENTKTVHGMLTELAEELEVLALASGRAIAAGAGQSVFASYESRREALSWRSCIVGAIGAATSALETMSGSAFAGETSAARRALQDLTAAIGADINERIGRLPDVLVLRPDMPVEAWQIAHHLFGDNPRMVEAAFRDIVRRNRPRHPAYMEGPVEVLK